MVRSDFHGAPQSPARAPDQQIISQLATKRDFRHNPKNQMPLIPRLQPFVGWPMHPAGTFDLLL